MGGEASFASQTISNVLVIAHATGRPFEIGHDLVELLAAVLAPSISAACNLSGVDLPSIVFRWRCDLQNGRSAGNRATSTAALVADSPTLTRPRSVPHPSSKQTSSAPLRPRSPSLRRFRPTPSVSSLVPSSAEAGRLCCVSGSGCSPSSPPRGWGWWCPGYEPSDHRRGQEDERSLGSARAPWRRRASLARRPDHGAVTTRAGSPSSFPPRH